MNHRNPLKKTPQEESRHKLHWIHGIWPENHSLEQRDKQKSIEGETLMKTT
ncbi:hypothetical protein YC2023_106391 [Brassica napus]